MSLDLVGFGLSVSNGLELKGPNGLSKWYLGELGLS